MWRLVLVLLTAAGCATVEKKPPVRPERLDWNGVRATWRTFEPGAICEAEPRFLLDELLSVNELLKRFLRDTEGGEDAPWTEAQVALVKDGRAQLPPVMEVHSRNLAELERCAFKETLGYPVVRKRGRELLERTRDWLDEAPRVIARVHRQRALEAWHEQRLSSQETARRNCPSARLGATVIYFAYRDPEGLTSFYFCDGAAVLQRSGESPKLEPAPVELAKGRRPTPKTYFAAAERFPAEAILSPPSP